jgi:hypothetical protein
VQTRDHLYIGAICVEPAGSDRLDVVSPATEEDRDRFGYRVRVIQFGVDDWLSTRRHRLSSALSRAATP